MYNNDYELLLLAQTDYKADLHFLRVTIKDRFHLVCTQIIHILDDGIVVVLMVLVMLRWWW